MLYFENVVRVNFILVLIIEMGNIYYFNRLCCVVNDGCFFSYIIYMKLFR